MKLTVSHLGRIEHAEIDLAPFTVFVGPNSTNKTWVTYSLFALLEGLRWEDQRLPGAFTTDPDVIDAVNTTVKRLRDRVLPNTSVVETISGATMLSHIRRPLVFDLGADGIRAAVGQAAPVADDARVSLSLDAASDPIGEIRLTLSGKELLVEFPAEDTGRTVLAPTALASQLLSYARARFPSVRCLPVERALLASLAPEILAQRMVLRRPLVDFAFMMAKAQARAGADGPLGSKLAPWLERTVGGRYERTARGVAFVPSGGTTTTIPLAASSSLVQSLAGIWAYLREIGDGDVLLIDEPEMNAHPAAQLAIVELLAILASSGVRIVVTTHSPYVLDHLGTLVEASRLSGDPRSKIVSKLRLGRDEALLQPEQLSVYRFDIDGTVHSIFDRESRTIDPSTFAEVGDAEANLFSEVLAAERTHGV